MNLVKSQILEKKMCRKLKKTLLEIMHYKFYYLAQKYVTKQAFKWHAIKVAYFNPQMVAKS